MPTQAQARLLPKTLIAAFLVALPAIVFYGILFQKAINVPLDDDYEALLDFLNNMVGLESAPARASYFFAAQFNEYKLFFGHALAWLQFSFSGHADLRVLCAIGNGSVLLLAILLWEMSPPGRMDLPDRLAAFIPSSFLLFGLSYADTLDWAMPGLQNIFVLVFSLSTIYILVGCNRREFCAALVGLVLAISASGNGLLLIPIGVIILFRNRALLAAWLIVSAGCAAAYAYRYSVLSPHGHHSIPWPHPIYALAFIGNAAAIPGLNRRPSVLLGLLLGLLISLAFVDLMRRGYPHRNPAVCYCVLFLLLTSVAVSGIRSDLGLFHSLDSRYKIYSILILIFLWIAIVDEFIRHKEVPLRRNGVFVVACACAAIFSMSMDAWGWFHLEERNQRIIGGMRVYEQTGSRLGPILPFQNQGERSDELERRAPLILKRSTELGIYRPPAF